eukprot:snap_masked-scaffold_45-processed-gene-0.41-mRNA-1 protein AED:1.00 eAED:1.00 QI:0/0/0/0/1/1/4/0/302
MYYCLTTANATLQQKVVGSQLSDLRNEHFINEALNKALRIKEKRKNGFDSKLLSLEISRRKQNAQIFYEEYNAIKNTNYITTQVNSGSEIRKVNISEIEKSLIEKIEFKISEKLVFFIEEFNGQSLDLQIFYSEYSSMKEEKVTYDYSKVKFTTRYKKYLEDLAKYLLDFFNRTQPLAELDIQSVAKQKVVEYIGSFKIVSENTKNELQKQSLKVGGRKEDQEKRLKLAIEKEDEKIEMLELSKIGLKDFKVKSFRYPKKTILKTNVSFLYLFCLEEIIREVVREDGMSRKITKTKERVTKK